MNWGAFAGGFAKGFNDTYRMLSEDEERKLAREERRQRMEREEQGRTAARETLGRVGTQSDFTQAIQTSAQVGPQQARAIQAGTGDVEFDQAVAQSATDVMRETAMRKGAIPTTADKAPPLQGQTYTEGQAYQDYSRRMAGIDPEKALSARVQGLQLEDLTRKAENARQFDALRTELNTTLAKISGTAEANGLRGLAEEANKAGLKVEYRAGKDNIGGRVAVLGPKGDVLETITDVNSAVQKLQGLVMDQFSKRAVGLLGSTEAFLTEMRGQRKDVIDAAKATSEIEKNRAQTSYLGASAQKLAEDAASNADVRAVVAPIMDKFNKLTPEQQDGPDGQKLLIQATAAAARKTGDFKAAASLTSYGRAEEAYAKAAAEAAKNDMPLPDRNKFFAQYGFAPDAVQSGQQAKVDQLVAQGKRTEAEALVKQHNSVFKHSPLQIGGAQETTAPTAPTGGDRPGSAIPPAPAPAAPARTGRGMATPAGDRIPEPPPKELIKGTNRRPNPAYVEWEKQYGERYRAQQR